MEPPETRKLLTYKELRELLENRMISRQNRAVQGAWGAWRPAPISGPPDRR